MAGICLLCVDDSAVIFVALLVLLFVPFPSRPFFLSRFLLLLYSLRGSGFLLLD